ncbi:hypothetical protein KBD34_03985 [Patescibacteria group bacterium]|nr:hypothetical protein [Patescibacteria group bacterium]
MILRFAGTPIRAAVGRLAAWALEGEVTDAVSGNVPALLGALVLGLSHRYVVPLLGKAGFNYKSWEVAPFVLKAMRLVLRETQYRINIPTRLLNVWSNAAGVAVNAGYEGLIEGTISRAQYWLEEVGKKISAKSAERKREGASLTIEDRRQAIEPAIYDTAEKLLPARDGDKKNASGTDTAGAKDTVKTTKDTSHIEGMGREMDIFAAFDEAEEKAKDDPVAQLKLRGKRTALKELQGTHPKAATAIIRASAHGLLPSGETMRILGLPDDLIDDPRAPRDAPRKITIRTDALLALATAAENRLKEAQPAAKAEEKKDPDGVEKAEAGDTGDRLVDPSAIRRQRAHEHGVSEGVISLYGRTVWPRIKWPLIPIWGPVWVAWRACRFVAKWLVS